MLLLANCSFAILGAQMCASNNENKIKINDIWTGGLRTLNVKTFLHCFKSGGEAG